MAAPQWCSKDRFAAKRLRSIADGLDPAKRALIEKHSAFSSMLNVSPFNVPNELIDFVAVNTDPKLREFQYGKKRIVFTKQMVSRVYGLRSGSKKVKLLGKSDQSAMRDAYKGDLVKVPIKIAATMLHGFAIEDEDAIIRTWDLLCVATVLNPGSGNMMLFYYIGSMEDPKKTDEFDWDEHLLELAMINVDKIKKKKGQPVVVEKGSKKPDFWISGPIPLLATIYVDHLDYPPNDHKFDYSVPRACFVTSSNFAFVVQTDLDRLILHNKTIFGRRPFLELSKTPYAANTDVDAPALDAPAGAPALEESEVNPSASLNEWLVFPSSQEMEVPSRFKHLYLKHKALFASDVDATLKSLATGLKSMQSQRKSSLLVDVDAAMREADDSNIVFPNVASQDQYPNNKNGSGSSEQGRSKEDDVNDEETDLGAANDVELNMAAAQDAVGHDGAPIVDQLHASEHSCGRVPDEQQTAVIIDSNRTGGDSGLQEDASSPIRSVFPVFHVPIPTPTRFIPPGYWDDCPSFELFSQDDPLFMGSDDAPTRASDAPGTVDVCMPCAAEGPTGSNKEGNTPDVSSEAVVPVLVSNTTEATAAVIDVSTPYVPVPKTKAAVIDISTPDVPKTKDVATNEVTEKPASTGIATIDRKNRHKRAAKDDAETPKLKKIKVSKDVSEMYSKFVAHSRKFKNEKKSKEDIPKPFIVIGRIHCTYRSFQVSLKPRKTVDTQLMDIWLENFNKINKGSKYAFSCLLTMRLSVDPESFDAKKCMKEFKQQYELHKFLKDGLMYFALVKNNHWVLCSVNMVYKQFHLFDSYRTSKNQSILEISAKNVFTNFATLVDASKVVKKINWAEFKHITPPHPQQTTVYDCGYFCMLYMENFNARFMVDFDANATPSYRMLTAANLIEARENPDDLVKIMDEDLV